ncbi:hypothetical protein MBLNU230_g2774t1 [Neophaeotheca triangularis]
MPDKVKVSECAQFSLANVYVYLMDYEEATTSVSGVRQTTAHQLKCQTAKACFGDFVDAEMHEVSFEKGTSTAAVVDFWKTEMTSKSADDLVIIWFHGDVVLDTSDDDFNELGYEWCFRYKGYPRKNINAFDLVSTISDSPPSKVLLMDCDVPDKWPESWRRTMGNTEIIYSGGSATNARVTNTHGVDDFSVGVFDSLANFIEHLSPGGKHQHKEAPRTIPEIMSFNNDVQLIHKPRRIWFDKPKSGSNALVERIMICPVKTRETKKLSFVSVVIQGEKYVESQMDEGFSDMADGDNTTNGKYDPTFEASPYANAPVDTG